MFHGRWLEHGSRTVLAETSNAHELFMMDSCDDNPIATIVQKIRVCLIEDDEPFIDGSTTNIESSDFVLRFAIS